MKRQIVRVIRVAVAFAAIGGTAYAAQQTEAGKLLLVKNPNGTPPKRKINLKVIEPGSASTVVGDPVANGAKLKVKLDANTDCYNLPASGWSPISTIGFKYKDPSGANGPVKVAQIKKTPGGVFQLKALALGKNGTITVVPPATQADTNFHILLGDEHCSTFGGTINPNDDKTFKAQNASAPGGCNVTACSTSGAFLDDSLL